MQLSQELDKDYEEKMFIAEMDCDNGKGAAPACHSVGEFFAVVRDDHKRAAEKYEKNCNERSYAPSCFNLARLYTGGKGREQSFKEAARLYEKSCDMGHAQGCHLHAMLLLSREAELPMDPPRAIKQLDKACDGDDAPSCYMLGSYLLSKSEKMAAFLKRDPLRALPMLERGCTLSHGPSCFNLAVMYKNGDDGIPSDQAKFEQYQTRTNDLVAQAGALQGFKVA